MKKLLLITLLAIFISCDKNSPEESETKSDLIGRWFYDYERVDGVIKPYNGDFSNCPKPNEEYVELTIDGKINLLFFDMGCTTFIESGTYTLKGDVFTVKIQGQTVISTIKELSFSRLAFETELDYDDDGSINTVISFFKR